ncbi:MAG: DinB family protein [Gemmatimonadaceae bacterium]
MTQSELLAAAAVNSWKLVTSRLNDMIASMSDSDLEQVVAPGRNRVSYLVGHLAAVHDRMFTLLGVGERMHPELDAEFLETPDTHGPSSVSAADLRKAWTEVDTKLTSTLESLRPEQWLEKHTSVSDEEFAKDPLRNRLSVLMSRTNHASFHIGQMRLTR